MVKDQAENLRKKMNKDYSTYARTIAIFSGKGGVGKSNFAVNFSVCLSKQGKRVLIFDLDIGMGNVDLLLGLHPKHNLTTMFEKSLQLSDIIEVGPGNLSYIASGNGLTDFFHLTEGQFNYFSEQLNNISSQYDYIIFDLGAGMSEEHLTFISAADECIVVTTPEPTSYMDAYSAMKHVIIELPTINMSLLLNNVSSQQEKSQVYDRIYSVVHNFLNYDLKLFGALPNDPLVSEAVKKQTPFYIINNRSIISKALAKIVLDYLKENNQKDSKEENYNFVTRLKSMFVRKVD
ncbi:MinD/ParA family protein [Bacillaceae bacterium W0354]